MSIVRRKEKMRKEEPLKLEINHFVDCVMRGLEPIVKGEHAANALELAVEISELVKKRVNDFPELG